MRLKPEIQGVHPRVEVYPNKKKKHSLRALIKKLSNSISLKAKRGQ